MPFAPGKICAKYGCNERVRMGVRFCAVHAEEDARLASARKARTNARKPAIHRKLYGRSWRSESRAFLAVNNVCVECGRPGADTVDHKIRHGYDPALFWDQSNWQPMHRRCHNRKTARHDGGFGNPVRKHQHI